MCDTAFIGMSVTIAQGASLGKVADIIRNAILFGPDAWDSGSSADEKKERARQVLPTEPDVVDLFTLLCERQIPYLLVGGIAMLRYVKGRNTEDIDLLMSLPSLQTIPEISIEDQNDFFARGYFRRLRVDILLTANVFFAEVQENFGTLDRFAEVEVSTATPEGLVLLKLYALPSLYRQGQFDRVSVYESDIASLLQGHRLNVEGLLQRLEKHMLASDIRELRSIIRDIQARIARFENLKKA
jgi:hypothetical protein